LKKGDDEEPTTNGQIPKSGGSEVGYHAPQKEIADDTILKIGRAPGRGKIRSAQNKNQSSGKGKRLNWIAFSSLSCHLILSPAMPAG